MKTLTKQEEIELLTKLAAGGGYFADQFKHDLGRMICNIKNDFPIIHETAYENKIHDLNKRIEEQKEITRAQEVAIRETCDKEKSEIITKILEEACKYNYIGLYDYIVEKIGIDKTVKLKRTMGFELSDKEIDYLISKI